MIRRNLASLDDREFRADLDEDGRLSNRALSDALIEMNMRRNEYQTLGKYYMGENSHILAREQPDNSGPDNRIPVPYAASLVDTVVGYMYKPGLIQYQTENETLQEALDDVFWANEEKSKTSRLGKLASIFGVAYELHYRDENGEPRFAPVPPEDMLPIYNNDIEPEIVAALRRWIEPRSEEVDGRTEVEHIDVYYEDIVRSFTVRYTGAQNRADIHLDSEEEHGYGMVPVAVYQNNQEQFGDFERVLKLIDAYDVLMSDSMNEFDRFAWAYLVLKGMSLTEDDEEKLKKLRVFETVAEGGVDFLTKDIQHEFIEFMRKWIKEELHKQTHIPDMADEQFAGQQSGIAIRYKLNDLENIASVKETYFRHGLYRRLRLLLQFFAVVATAPGTIREVDITFHRNIPANFGEQAEIAQKLAGLVSRETLYNKVLDFVDDAAGEMQRLEDEADIFMEADSAGQEEGPQKGVEEGQIDE